MKGLFSLAVGMALAVVSAGASAETLQAPIGGRAIAIGGGRVVCGAAPLGWTLEPDGRALRPPTTDDAIGVMGEVHVAADTPSCTSNAKSITVVATGKWPQIDAASVTLFADEGRVEVKGDRLKGVRLAWSAAEKSGVDACLDPQKDGATLRCGFSVPRSLTAETSAARLSWLPVGARVGDDVTTFDDGGRVATHVTFALPIARVVVDRMIAVDTTIDVSKPSSALAVRHAEAIASVECSGASCERTSTGIAISSVTNVGDRLSVKLRLAPHVYARNGELLDPTPVAALQVLHCPMSIASGAPMRDVEGTRVVVRLDGRCGVDASKVRFAIGAVTVTTERVEATADATFVVLRVGTVAGDSLTIQARRDGEGGSIVGVAETPTRAAIHPHATLEIVGVGAVDFIPTNRDAAISLPSAGVGAHLVPLPIDGVYTVDRSPASTSVRGARNGSGYVSLRYGYRVDSLPAALRDLDLAVLLDSSEVPLKQANVPAPIGTSTETDRPLVELVCGDGKGGTRVIAPGVTAHVSYEERDSCRFVFHRERLHDRYGAQKLELHVDVTKVSGDARPDAHVAQTVVMRPGGEARNAWVKGVDAPFDRVSVRIGHAGDETHYVASDLHPDAPSAQWSVVMGTGHWRLYGTTAIPTGIYRVSDRAHSGILSLNFGVLARLTWLDGDGHEGFLGLETGVMGVGLANDQSSSGHSLTQVASVFGIGLGIPIANRSSATETSINLHAWVEYEVSRAVGGEPGSPWAFVFGPSFSIGNVGVNL